MHTSVELPPQTSHSTIRDHLILNGFGHRMSSLLFALTCALTAVGLVFLVLGWSSPVPDTFAFRGHAALLALAFGGMGWFLATRLPRNSIGWLFLVAGIAASIQDVGQEYAAYALLVYVDGLPSTRLIAWIASWIPGVALSTIMMVVLIFPDGRLPSKRWRPFAWLQVGLWLSTLFASMIKPGPLRFAPFLENPFAAGAAWGVIIAIANPLLAASIVVMGVALVSRLTRAKGIERQQLKWFTYAAALTCGVGLVYTMAYRTIAISEPALTKPIDILAIIIPLMIPAAMVMAILRYRLYDIDRVINRTLVYGTLSASVIITYVLIVGVFGALLNEDVELAALFATIVLAALAFQPGRARLQRAVDRLLPVGGEGGGAVAVVETPKYAAGPLAISNWLPWLVFALSSALAALDIILMVLNSAVALPFVNRWSAALFAPTFGGVGLMLARKRPQNAIGWLFILMGLVEGIWGAGTEYAAHAMLVKPGLLPGAAIVGWVVSWIWMGAIALASFLFLLYPTGRLPSTRWRPLAWATAVAFGAGIIDQMVKPGPLRYAPYLDHPFVLAGTGNLILAAYPLIYLAVAACQVAGAVCIIMRLRRARGIERQQLKYFAYSAGLLVAVGIPQSIPSNLGLAAPEWWNVLTLLLDGLIGMFPVTVGLAILRHRLWDIDILINRTLVYGALTGGIVALYILLVGALGTLSQTSGNLLISLLATGLIAILFQPFRDRLQRAVNRLTYGERDDPFALMTRLGQNLETSVAPDTALSSLVRKIAQALKLPYVAIETHESEGGGIFAAYGQAPQQAERIPVVYQGERVGRLIVASRSPNEPLSTADLNMLHINGQQAGMAVHAIDLTADLQRSREQLVVAREEERRRIRRDLHDGLGPVLA